MQPSSSDSVGAGSLRRSVAGVPSGMRLGAIQWLIISAAGLVMAIMLGTGYFALQFRERTLEVAERELNNSALLMSSPICGPTWSIPPTNLKRRCRH